MQVKNMGYSPKQLIELMSQMENVVKTSENTFQYKGAYLKVENLASLQQFSPYLSEEDIARLSIQSPILSIDKRSLLVLEGNPQDIEGFYMNFLLNYLTMGG